MKKIDTLYVFNDLNGRIVYKPFDVFEDYAKSKDSDVIRFTR